MMEQATRTQREDVAAALAMVDAFASVGAESFDVTRKMLDESKAPEFSRHVPTALLKSHLPTWLPSSNHHQLSLIIRPVSNRTVFVQLDDLDRAAVDRTQPVAFLSHETSPGNYQAWVAFPVGECDKDLARRLRAGVGADKSASGATRIAGSLNFKEKFAPDFPRVTILHRADGRFSSASQLVELGLLAPEPKAATPLPQRRRPGPGSRRWPDYQICLRGAPPKKDGSGPDISLADFTWCMTAFTWEWSIEEIAAQLLEISPKAQENGERYALLTAQNAAAAVERRQRSRA